MSCSMMPSCSKGQQACKGGMGFGCGTVQSRRLLE